MADETRVSATGPNGDRLDVKVAGNVFGLTTRELPFIVVLVMVGILGYFRIVTHNASLQEINAHLQGLYARQDQQQSDLQKLLLGEFAQQREQLRAQSELIVAEGQQLRAALRENREVTATRMQKQDALLDEQTKEMRHHHAVILFNMQRDPSQHLSLDLPIPAEPLPRR